MCLPIPHWAAILVWATAQAPPATRVQVAVLTQLVQAPAHQPVAPVLLLRPTAQPVVQPVMPMAKPAPKKPVKPATVRVQALTPALAHRPVLLRPKQSLIG